MRKTEKATCDMYDIPAKELVNGLGVDRGLGEGFCQRVVELLHMCHLLLDLVPQPQRAQAPDGMFPKRCLAFEVLTEARRSCRKKHKFQMSNVMT